MAIVSVIVLRDGKVDEYKVDSDAAAIRLYGDLQIGKERQEVYLRDNEGKDYKLTLQIQLGFERVSVTKDVKYVEKEAQKLHESLFQKREGK